MNPNCIDIEPYSPSASYPKKCVFCYLCDMEPMMKLKHTMYNLFIFSWIQRLLSDWGALCPSPAPCSQTKPTFH